MDNGIDLIGRLARIGYKTLASRYCCVEEGPKYLALAYFTSCCTEEFGLDLAQQQTLTNLMVDMHVPVS